MRIALSKRLELTDVATPVRAAALTTAKRDHAKLVASVNAVTTPEERVGALLFVGGRHAIDLPVRAAQSILRVDRTLSPWSHVAILLDWPKDAPADRIIGLEVALDPSRTADQVPERGGATLFRLSRYLDASSYPCIAIGVVTPGTLRRGDSSVQPREAMMDAALSPIRGLQRFPMWEWLGHWHRYVRAGGPNPLVEHIPHPAAALCEYVYEAGGMDLTPGSTSPTSCPEQLWATLRYWYDSMGAAEGASNVRIWRSDLDSGDGHAPRRPEDLDLEVREWTGRSLRASVKSARSSGKKAAKRPRRGP